MQDNVEEGPSFIELIKVREAQQAQIRAALAAQNQRLREKLARATSESPARSGSEPDAAGDVHYGSTAGKSHQAAAEGDTPPRDGATKQPHPPGAPPAAVSRTTSGTTKEKQTQGGSAVEGASSGGQPSSRRDAPSGISVEAFKEVQDMIGSLQKLVHSIHESDKAAIEALREHIDSRCDALEQKIMECQSAVAVEEKTSALLREEQTSQNLTICGELESIRAAVDASTKRLDARDDAISALQQTVGQINETSENHEERLVSVEGFPAALRQELRDLDEQFKALTASTRAERASLLSAHNDQQARQEAEFRETVDAANEELKQLQKYGQEAISIVQQSKDNIANMVNHGIEQLASRLEDEIAGRIEDQDKRIAASQQRQAVENHNTSQAVTSAIGELRNTVDSALSALRSEYDKAVRDQLDAIIDAADEHERQRREEFPVLDADRVAIMLNELQGAQTMIEGIARNTMAMGHKCPLAPRMKELESKLDDLTVECSNLSSGVGKGSRISFNVDVQTDPLSEDQLPPHERIAAMVERRLAAEMERAAAEQQDAQFKRSVSEAERSASQQSTAPRRAGQSAPPLPTSDAAPLTTEHRSKSVAAINSGEELKAAIRVKEGQLEKVQKVLRTIQEKFHELTQRESRSSSNRSSSLAPEARQVAEMIAKQKEQVYQHERQLVEQRNQLLRDLKDLSIRLREVQSAN